MPTPPRPDDDGSLSELITVRDWLRWGISHFNAAGLVYGHGTTRAVDEAAFLVLHALNLPIDELAPWLDARLTMRERKAVRELLLSRIETRKPAPYLTNCAWIGDARFFVDERVIVPRSYIGELLQGEDLSAFAPEPEAVRSILDLCTGSGCLAILAARRFADAKIDATDLSADALAVARRNLAGHGLVDRITLHSGDLFAPVRGRRYDLILANPPYVAAAEVAAFPPEYAHEPKLAHLGGEDGLDLARRILAEASTHLTEAGHLVMEIGTGREILEAEFPTLEFFWLDTAESQGEVFVLSAAQLGVGMGRKRKGR